MAVPPKAISDYLERKPPRVPDWKKSSIETLHSLIMARTGIPFKLTKGPPLFDHQFRSLAAALYLGRCMLFLGMRLGKTRITLEWAQHLRNAGLWRGRALIIVPSPTVLNVWKKQVKEYVNLSCEIVTSQDPDSLMRAIDAKTDLTVIPISALQVIFTSRQAVQKRGWDEPKNMQIMGIPLIEAACECFTMSIVDEIHYCKNFTSLWTQMVTHLTFGHEFKMGLTGTPFDRRPFDVWSQMNIIDQGQALGSSYFFFRKAFANRVVVHGQYKFNKRKLKHLTAKLESSSISYKLEEVRQLKELRYVTKREITGEQKKEYNDLLAGVKDQREMSMAAQENTFVGLLQISSGTVPFRDTYGIRTTTMLPEHAKLTWLRARIAEGAFSVPTVIFHRFIKTGVQIREELMRAGIQSAYLNGTLTVAAARDKQVELFQSGKVPVIVCNFQSGSVAIDLSEADWMVFYEPAPSATLRLQAEKRPAGPARGDRSIIIEDLIVSPIEEHAASLVEEGRKTLNTAIFSGVQMFRRFKAL